MILCNRGLILLVNKFNTIVYESHYREREGEREGDNEQVFFLGFVTFGKSAMKLDFHSLCWHLSRSTKMKLGL